MQEITDEGRGERDDEADNEICFSTHHWDFSLSFYGTSIIVL